jgi:Flp pilus assembly protein TadG
MSLTFGDARADKASVTSVWTLARRGRRDERGQALVEFAIIAPLFLMLVIGVIQFAVALNFWFDMQRLANQGARAATVNCGANAASPSPNGNLCRTSAGAYNLKQSLIDQIVSTGNSQNASSQCSSGDCVEICYVPPDPAATPPAGFPTTGDAVRVTLKKRYRLQAIVNLAKIDLVAKATMRLEQDPHSTSGTPVTAAGLPDPNAAANWVSTGHTGNQACQP